MTRLKSILPLLLLLSILLHLSCSQITRKAGSCGDVLNLYQKDFLKLSSYVRRTHAGFRGSPLTIMSESEYDSLTRTVIDDLKETDSLDDFLIKISCFFEKLNDGHTRVFFPFREFAPITVRWFGDRVYIIAVGDNRYESLLYGEILRVGDMPMEEYETLINGYIPSDRNHLLSKRMFSQEYMFSRAFLKYFGLLSEEGLLKLKVLSEKGLVEMAFPCRYEPLSPRAVMNERARTALTAGSGENSWTPLPEEKAVYLQLNHLRGDVDRELYNEVFSCLKENHWPRLIVDLRNNGGGNSLWCNEFLSYLTDEERDVFLYKGWESHYPGRDRKRSGGITRIKPKGGDLYFDGDVIYLTSPYTFSSATFFVVAAIDNDMGTVIGEPAGNTSLRYGYCAEPIKLPHTGLRFYTTHHIWGRAKPGMMNEGEYIKPHYPISPALEDMRDGRDRVYESALDYKKSN